jgi:hypothetical protein
MKNFVLNLRKAYQYEVEFNQKKSCWLICYLMLYYRY